jgi:hypothetical protein
MGDKYTPEELAKLRSIAVNSGGRTKHNDAGVPIEAVREIRSEEDGGKLIRETVDHNQAVVTEHQDGRQDVGLNPKAIKVDMKMTQE